MPTTRLRAGALNPPSDGALVSPVRRSLRTGPRTHRSQVSIEQEAHRQQSGSPSSGSAVELRSPYKDIELQEETDPQWPRRRVTTRHRTFFERKTHSTNTATRPSVARAPPKKKPKHQCSSLPVRRSV